MLGRLVKDGEAPGPRMRPPAGVILLLALALGAGALLWKARKAAHDPAFRIRGSWAWSDSSIFEFQKIEFRFTADSFFLAQKFIDPRHPDAILACAQRDHWLHAAGPYVLAGDTLRFKGSFTDGGYSRDTLRLCRDTGFKGRSHFVIRKDSLWLQAPGSRKNVQLTRLPSAR